MSPMPRPSSPLRVRPSATHRGGWLATAAVFTALAPTAAHAGNGIKPRTPVVFEDIPCLTVVDRSASPLLEIPYTIPFEDVGITPDEVPDSRTHQFVGLCRNPDPRGFLPTYLSAADMQAAIDIGVETPDRLGDIEDILELSPRWTDCYLRVTADAERRPITFEAASAPVVWDTTDVEPGTYTIFGYTWEPPFNLWAPAAGAPRWTVKVVDSPDLAASAPAAVIYAEEDPIIFRDERATIEACASAMEGSTYSVYWATDDADDEVWRPVVEGVAVPPGSARFAFDYTPEPEVYGSSAVLKIVVEDPMGRRHESMMSAFVYVLDQDTPVDTTSSSTTGDDSSTGTTGSDSASSSGGPGTATDGTAGESNTDGVTTGNSSGDSSTSGSAGGDAGEGGGCAVGRTGGAREPLALMLVLALAGLGLGVRRAPAPQR
jgi:hypothetical protein